MVSFGGPPLPYIQPTNFPGVDFVVIAKGGHVTTDFAHNPEAGRKAAGGGNAGAAPWVHS